MRGLFDPVLQNQGAFNVLGPRRKARGLEALWGAITSGLDDPSLSAEQNKRARQQAAMIAGLQMMANSGPSAQPKNLGQILGEGFLAGQQVGVNARQGYAQENAVAQKQARQAQLQQLVSSTPPDQLPQLAQQLLAGGYAQEASAVVSLINATKQAQRNPVDYQRFQGADGKLYVMNPETKAVEPLRGPNGEHMAAPPQAMPYPSYQFLPTPSGLMAGNTRSGDVSYVEAPGGGVVPTQDAATRASAISAAMQSLDNYSELLGDFMSLPAPQRALMAAGGGDQAMLGRVEAAQYNTMLQLKEAARLGALTGPDMRILEGMIGNPSGLRALIRKSDYTTSKLPEAAKYLRQLMPQAQAQPRAASSQPPGFSGAVREPRNVQNPSEQKRDARYAPANDAESKAAHARDAAMPNALPSNVRQRVDLLRKQGKTAQQIIAQLRIEGLVK